MIQKPDILDWIIGGLLLLVMIMVFSIMKTAAQHQQAVIVEPAIWTGPPIPQCDKELWERIRKGCKDE